jgi:hypothetical protein
VRRVFGDDSLGRGPGYCGSGKLAARVYVLAVDLRGLENMLAGCTVWIPVLRVDDVHVDETFVAA